MAIIDGPDSSPEWVTRLRQGHPGLSPTQWPGGRVIGEPWDKSVPFDEEFTKAPAGICVAGKHYADSVWLVPNDGNTYCKTHLRSVLRIAVWPESFRTD